MNHLELFSGTHSFGKVSSKHGYTVYSLDRDLSGECPFSDYVSANHIKEDILTWDYKQFPQDFFSLITASPVCLWWSNLRSMWIGRTKNNKIYTKDDIEYDINNLGKPMVDKVFEIIDYFKPKKWIIENPYTSKMKHYIEAQYPHYNTYNDYSYCKFTNWGYEKKTRFWNNLNKEDCLCKKDCSNMIVTSTQKVHRIRMGTSKTIIDNNKIIRVNTKTLREKYKDWKGTVYLQGKTSKWERYRIPEKIIERLIM